MRIPARSPGRRLEKCKLGQVDAAPPSGMIAVPMAAVRGPGQHWRHPKQINQVA